MNHELYENIREQFHKEEAKLLLINPYMEPNDYWYKINKESNIHSTGFCYLASEVYYHQTGKAKRWWFKEIKSDKLPYNGHHYYLQDKETGEIVDLTADQFGDIVIPYEESKNRGIRFESKAYKEFIKLLNGRRTKLN